ncbi:MAG: type VI secretion system contractile sheath large subunit [Conexibacteraceae bacterium]|nr:type VI secretion system contractile sheath large subunit [Conexibacteraceae bacterium]
MLRSATRPPPAGAAAGPLRHAVLSGRFARAEAGDLACDLAALLEQDHGALALWLGSDAVAAVGHDPPAIRALIERDIVAIDRLIARQLDAVLHHPRLQRLEGSWRGLARMVGGFEGGPRLKTRLLAVRWDEIGRDLARASQFDQSAVFRLIYESEFGTAGGEPFGLMVIDHELRHTPEQRTLAGQAPVDDVSVLAELSAIAAAAFMPMVFGAAPALLGVDAFADLALSNDIAAAFRDEAHARWRALTTREDARFLAVTMPRALARPRWRAGAQEHRGFRYEEHAAGPQHHTWCVAGYAFAATVGRAQARFNWPGDVRGVTPDRVGGGLVTDLPAEPFVFGPETWWNRPTLDLTLTDRQEQELVLAGLMPLNALPHGDAAFASVHSLQARHAEAVGRAPSAAGANTHLSAQINAMLCVSRFAHYIKIIGRELTGAFLTAGEIERRLQSWLAGYTNASQSPDPDSRARHPLVSSRVSVHELRDQPGSFGCVLQLQPFYQLDDVSATFRLVTGFAAAAGRPQ